MKRIPRLSFWGVPFKVLRRLGICPAAFMARLPSYSNRATAIRGQPCAADQHEVGRLLQSDVPPEHSVPDVVERKTDERIQTTCRHQQTAN